MLRELPAMSRRHTDTDRECSQWENTARRVMKLTFTVNNETEKPLPFDDSPTAWMAQGNCRNYPPATFFPSDGVGVDRARNICKGCPVGDTCLEYALEQRIEHGVWGGCSERERRRILKRRRGIQV